MIRSRISSRGHKNPPKEESSGNLEADYSQDFDSYSASMLSRTNTKKKEANSEFGDSYSISVSQSYRK